MATKASKKRTAQAKRSPTKTKARSKPKAKTKPKQKPKTKAEKLYFEYVEGVAANANRFGVPRALEICLDMYTYEFQAELKVLKQAAIADLAAKRFAPIVALATARKLAFTEADAETMLRGLAGADDNFQPIQE